MNMAKTTYKVGDKVRILNADKILLGCEIKIIDGYAEVESVRSDELPRLACVDGSPLIIARSEVKYIEKAAEQVAKFKVGDKVRVTNDNFEHKKGDIRIINRIGSASGTFDYGFEGGGYIKECNIELAPQKPTKNQRITTLEQTVADLQAEVEALKAAQKLPTMTVKADVDIAKIAESLAKAIEKHSPNERRKAIIDEAKSFVEELTAYISPTNGGYSKNHPKYGEIKREVSLRIANTYFTVKADKREVTCVIKPKNFENILSKATAKCAPDDVFNADIGKAIALGRALGLDVERFEKAVQPTEFAVGQVVDVASIGGGSYLVGEVTKVQSPTHLFFEKQPKEKYCGLGSFNPSNVVYVPSKSRIMDDTEAQY